MSTGVRQPCHAEEKGSNPTAITEDLLAAGALTIQPSRRDREAAGAHSLLPFLESAEREDGSLTHNGSGRQDIRPGEGVSNHMSPLCGTSFHTNVSPKTTTDDGHDIQAQRSMAAFFDRNTRNHGGAPHSEQFDTHGTDAARRQSRSEHCSELQNCVQHIS